MGLAGSQRAVGMVGQAKAVDLRVTRRPYGVAHGPPLINKWRAHPGGQGSSAGAFATAICRLTGIQNGHPPRLPVRRLLTLSLVTGGRAGEEKGGVKVGTHKGGMSCLPSLPRRWLLWVTKWSRESTQAFIINLSGSNRIPSILAPQSSCPPSCSTPLGGSPCRGVCLCGGSGENAGRGWGGVSNPLGLYNCYYSITLPFLLS